MMYGNFITSSKLTTVAESDLNTRLHNRNAYENRLRDYPLRCSNSLTCVYIDVNGLHELNNTYGHEEGDKMLRTVACILREIFGEEDSYRIGGDEFVAFALDSTGTELNENMEQFVRQVEAGYSVAVGTASHSAGGIDIDALVKRRSSGCIWTKADITNSCGAAPKNEHSAGKLHRRCAFLRPYISFFRWFVVQYTVMKFWSGRELHAEYDHCRHCHRTRCGRASRWCACPVRRAMPWQSGCSARQTRAKRWRRQRLHGIVRPFVDGGEKFDEGVALFFRAPHSYTGEDVVELSCHGGSAVARRLVEACLAAGAHRRPPASTPAVRS